jgi:small-conductance mechanosensitive channel
MRMLRPLLLAVLAVATSANRAPAQRGTASPARDTATVADSTPGAGQEGIAWVVLGTDTVMSIARRLGSITPAERAAVVRDHLTRLATDPAADSAGVVVSSNATTSDIMLGSVIVASISDSDAEAAGMPRAALADSVAARVRVALAHEGYGARTRSLLVGSALAFFVALATVALVFLLQRLFARLLQLVERGRGGWVPEVRFQRQVFLTSARLADVLLSFVRVLRIAAIVLVLYIALPVILSLFPWTRSYADRLVGYLVTPFASVGRAVLDYLPKLVTLAAIIVVARYLLKLIRLFFIGIEHGNLSFPNFHPEWAIPSYKIVRFLVIVFALIASWPYLPGSGSPAFQGIGVLVGLLISFGSASAISNVVGGIVLMYMRPFSVGDRVRIADTVGDVIEKDLLVTRVRTIKNVHVTIPNSMILASHIINYSATAARGGLILNTTVTIGYDAPWREVHGALERAAKATEGLLATPAPFVLQTALSDFYVSYELNAYTELPNRMAMTYAALHANIQDAFNAAGLEIMSPHFAALRDGNATTIPVAARGPGYRAPAFRVDGAPDRGAPAPRGAGPGAGEG